jgi:hypothetical protein
MEIPASNTKVSEAMPLLPQQPEPSVAARCKALIRVLQAIGVHCHPGKLFCRLATELRQVVPCDYRRGLYDEAANQFHWHLGGRLTQRVDGRLPDIPQEETIALRLPKWRKTG